MALQKRDVVEFIRSKGLGVVSTVTKDKSPEGALVNLAVTDDLELVFYAIETTRKCSNLRRNPRIAVVIGWDHEPTLQYEGLADEPQGSELERLKEIYALARPNAAGQMAWPGLTYFRVRPKWVRLSDYRSRWSVQELSF